MEHLINIRSNWHDMTFFVPAVNPSFQTFEVRADIAPSSISEVMAGQLVNVSVPIAQTRSTRQIPRVAIVLRAEGNYVFRISSDNKAQQIVVEAGEGSRDWVIVKGKLTEGDWVAIRGVERLQNGQQVSCTDS